MGFFTDKLIAAMFGGGYTCSKCGKKMIFEDDNESILLCESCGHSVMLEMYGAEDEEDYNSLYPRKEEWFDDDEDDDEEDNYDDEDDWH